MNTTEELRNVAANAMRQLIKRAEDGDARAILAIRDIALRATDALQIEQAQDIAKESLRWPGMPLYAIEIIGKAAGKRYKMPEVGTGLGIRLKEKKGAGRKREFTQGKPGEFALEVWQALDGIRRDAMRGNRERYMHFADIAPQLDNPEMGISPELLERSWKNLAALLEPLSEESLDMWTAAGVAYCREECRYPIILEDTEGTGRRVILHHDHWEDHAFRACVRSKASEKQETSEKPRGEKSAVQTQIRVGLKSLIP